MNMTLEQVSAMLRKRSPEVLWQQSEQMADAIDAHLAQPRAVPDGWVLVPEIATQAMVDAGSKEWRHQSVFGIWEAMLAAAPSPGESDTAAKEADR